MTNPKPVLLRELTDEEIWHAINHEPGDYEDPEYTLKNFRKVIAKATEMPEGTEWLTDRRTLEATEDGPFYIDIDMMFDAPLDQETVKGRAYLLWVPAPTPTVTLKGKEFTRAELEEGLAQIGKE